MAEKKNKDYNFTIVEFNTDTKKWYSTFGEIWTGAGATPEEAAKNTVDEYGLSPDQIQTAFYFTLDIGYDKRETGFIRLARTGLVVERIDL